MRFKRLDLNLLFALDVLLEERSVTLASKRLNLSQSATSGVMARLREYFDDELLVTVGRSMVLTPLAESLAAPVRDVLLQIQSTIETKPGFDALTSTRHYRVICSDYPGTVVMPLCARLLSERAPHATLEVIAPNDVMHQNIERAEVDLLILPQQYISGEHPHDVLFEDDYACVVWDRHPELGDKLSLEQYLAAGHIATNFGVHRAPTFEETYLRGKGHARRIEIITSSFNTLPQYLVGTRRMATMHRKLALLFSAHYPIRILDLPVEIPPIIEVMTWPKSMDKDLSHQFFRELLHEAVQVIECAGSD
ncbi:LysR family transcriptional regulator [Oxalobacteraceae bacterium]|nr:LysR family transcriptional regulator [Oxalobacteraceae bacterium]